MTRAFASVVLAAAAGIQNTSLLDFRPLRVLSMPFTAHEPSFAARSLIGVWMLTAAAALVAIAPSAAVSQERHITGTVRDSLSREALPNATLTVVGTTIRARTDEYGRFALLGVPPGWRQIEVKRLSYAPRVVALPDSVRAVTVLLIPISTQLAAVSVRAAPDLIKASEGVGVIELSPSELAKLPVVGEADVFRGLQLLPGVSGTSDASSGLSVRGGTADENLVLLDGMTVYHVDHFFGFFSAFNADAIKDVRLFKGGFGAKYGGRTSSVVDVVGKSGDNRRVKGTAGLSLLSVNATAEVPLRGKGSWLLSLRRSYTDVIRTGLYNRIFGTVAGTQSGLPNPPPGFGRRPPQATVVPEFYFYDVNSKLSLLPTERDVVTFSLYNGADDLDNSPSSGGGGGPIIIGPGGGSSPTAQLRSTSTWGNTGVSGRWSRTWTPRFTSNLLGATSAYHSEGERSTGTEALQFGVREDNRVHDSHVRLDNEWQPVRSWTMSFGVELTRNRVDYTFNQLAGDSVRGALDLGSTGTLSAGYSELRWSPSRRLELSAGVRGTTYDRTKQTYVEPRASGTVLLTDRWKLKGAWGRYNQFVKRVENENVLLGSRDFWLLAGDTVPVANAEHRIAGGAYENDDYLVDVEAYDKQLSGVSLFSSRARERPDQPLDQLFYTGTGNARGIEWLLQKKRGRLTGWASYTLSEARYKLTGFNNDRSFSASQDQRHEFKVVSAYHLRRWVLASTGVHGSGRPYTIPEAQYTLPTLDGDTVTLVHVGDKNAARFPRYHRVDVSASRHFDRGRFFYDLNFSVFNVYGRKNLWYRSFDLTQTPLVVTDMTTLGVTPSVTVRIGRR